MTLAALRVARELGYRIGIPQSSAVGPSIYRRPGLEQYSSLVSFRKHEVNSPEVANDSGARGKHQRIVVDYALPNEQVDEKCGKGGSQVGFTPSSSPYSPECVEGRYSIVRSPLPPATL